MTRRPIAATLTALAVAATCTACPKDPPPDNQPHRAAITSISPTAPAPR